LLCYAMLCYAMLCYAMLCYAMLCHAMPCHAMLCFAWLGYPGYARLGKTRQVKALIGKGGGCTQIGPVRLGCVCIGLG